MLWQSFRLAKATVQVAQETVQAVQPVQLRQLDLLDKMTTILVSKDVLAYQGVMAVQPGGADYGVFDPSDEAEADRERELYGKDRVIADEDDADLFAAFE